jgi:type VI secretion system secreted protein VgrG
MPPPITLSSPLPAEELLFESMTHSAGLSMLGETQLGLVSPKPNLDALKLLGESVTVNVALRDGGKRHFNGIVSRFGSGTPRGRLFAYQMTVRPWLWFLTRTSDCRIFQELSVPDIVKKVFDEHPAANFEFKTFRTYEPWDYCVQYRESDYNFIARLLEHEGIYWYVEHADGEHKIVLVDDLGAHDPAPSCDSLPYYANVAQVPPDTDYVSNWSYAQAVKAGKTVLTSYDFERPSTSLRVNAEKSRSYKLSDSEIFDFQGDYVKKPDGTHWVEDRLDEIQTEFDVASGTSNAQGVCAGKLLSLTRHQRDDQNRQHLVTALTVRARSEAFDSGHGGGDYRCEFSVIPADQQYRPPRRTPKPFVQGPQTAVVVGPSGEEIFTDKYGRVKVQFHWDRLGAKDEKSSCWVRVSHPWAGKNFGAIHIPRMGQEVVVDFLEGDPDQPLITGRVYNAEQMPPWELPANATQSGILTRSSKGGSAANANALRFEDKKGSEQVWLHAEKNQDIEVENDETHWVGHDRTKTIDHDETNHIKHDRTETVDNNETITIGVDRTESVGNNESITVGSNRSVTVGASETKTVALQRTHAVGANETIAIGAAQEVAIGAYQTVNVGTNQDVSVGKDQSTTIGANRKVDVGKDLETTVAKNEKRSVGEGRETSVGKDDKWQVGKKFYLEAADEITLKTGDASITMKKDGTIQIKGKDITITGSGKIGIKASGDMVLKGSKIAAN